MTLGNKYRLVRELGRGAVGVVFEATNLWTSRRVAVKILLPEHAADQELVHRFIGEARAAARIQHPNIVDVLDLDRSPEDGSLYLVLEYIEGGDLRAMLQRRRTLELSQAVELLAPVLDALEYAHAQGIVHRDLKPENILLARVNGAIVPKLIDFGISKFIYESGASRVPTAIGAVMGTPEYMSPEQAAGLPTVDHRTDLWAMGVILLELLTGRTLIDAENPMEVLSRLIYSKIPPIETIAALPRPAAPLIAKALQREIHERFDSAGAMRLALCSMTDPQAPTPPAPSEVSEQPPEMFEFSDIEESTVQTQANRGRSLLLERAQQFAERGEDEQALRACEEAEAAGFFITAERFAACELRVGALRWLGRLEEAAEAALELSINENAPLRARLRALWHLGWSGVWLADHAIVRRAFSLFRLLDQSEEEPADRAIAALRLGAYLATMGLRQEAETLLATAQRSLNDGLLAQLRVRAAVAEARASLAYAGGDLDLQVERLVEAESLLVRGGDHREAALLRVARADAMREIGASNAALAIISSQVDPTRGRSRVAEQWEQLIAIGCSASMAEPSAERAFQSRLEQFQTSATGQLRNQTSVLLAQLYLQRGLIREASTMVEELLSTPRARLSDIVAASAIRTLLLLRNDDPESAVDIARKAYEKVMQSQTYLASEGALRLAYAKALVVDNQMHLGWGMMVEARQRLGATAIRLSKPELRESYLRAVAAHAEIVRLGKRWLDVDVLNT